MFKTLFIINFKPKINLYSLYYLLIIILQIACKMRYLNSQLDPMYSIHKLGKKEVGQHVCIKVNNSYTFII